MIKVTCGIIQSNNKVLCVQRSETMAMPYKWEWPGGKVELGESEEECLIREIKEELNLTVEIIDRLDENYHIYSVNLTILLIPFICQIIGGELLLKEHRKAIWLDTKELLSLDWAEADIPIVKNYQSK